MSYKKIAGDTFLRREAHKGFYGALLTDTTRRHRLLIRRGEGGKYQTLFFKVPK